MAIDPKTGEYVPDSAAVKIDPATGERVTAPAQPASGGFLQGAKDFGAGLLKGAGSTLSNIDEGVAKIPYIGTALTTPLIGGGTSQQARDQLKQAVVPTSTMQKVGKGVEQAGEFLIPGAAEEEGVNLLSKALPFGEKAAPLLKTAAAATSAGSVNKAQGGDFKTGALAGAGGSLLGQGAAAVAPKIAEKAIGIGRADRGFGKDAGSTILNETSGIRPATIRDQAQAKIGVLGDKLGSVVDNASSKPATPIRGLLQAPQKEIPLDAGVSRGSTRGGLFNADYQPINKSVPESDIYGMDEIPGGEGINPHFLSGSEHPELSGRFAPPKGTLLSREATGSKLPTDQYGRVQFPEAMAPVEQSATQPNRIASLLPARNAVGSDLATAEAQNAGKTAAQIQPMQDFLNTRFRTGQAIPEQVTPTELLNLRRGFDSDFGHWNPDTLPGVADTSRRGYMTLTNELHRAVPESESIDRGISNLIPVRNAADKTTRNESLVPKILARVGAHTGAATLGGIGAVQGYHEGGVGGALTGGLLGLAAPELVGTPEGRMIAARTLAAPATRTAGRLLQGSALQLDRKDNQ